MKQMNNQSGGTGNQQNGQVILSQYNNFMKSVGGTKPVTAAGHSRNY